MGIRLWIGEVVVLVLVLDCLGFLADAGTLPPTDFMGIVESDLRGAHPRWARPKGLSAPKTRRGRSVLEVSPSQVNATAEAHLLLEFRKGVTRDPSNVLSSWNNNNISSYCSWTGVICSSPTGPVSALNLSGHQLRGTISPWLGGLQSVSSLDLSHNSFRGSIPTSIANCSNLTVLDLSFNAVSGEIPAELAALSNLEELALSVNQLTGAIPPSLSNLSALRILSLDDNLIKGGLASMDWGRFAHLESLNLSHNQFFDDIPLNLTKCSRLTYLALSFNNLIGEIPAEIGSLSRLQILYLGVNSLTGPIPLSLTNCSRLTDLELATNNLTGERPAQIGLLSWLQLLYLWDNSLTGPIPLSLTNCSRLTDLELSEDNLTGEIPVEIGLLSRLQYLYLDGNNLVGEIPAKIGSLSRLQALGLYSNSLTGPIPLSLTNCSRLTDVELELNNLTGEIPVEIGLLSRLEFLFLWGNSLTGPIPLSITNCSRLTDLHLSINKLMGEIPAEIGLLSRLNYLLLWGNSLIGPIPLSIMNCTFLKTLVLDDNYLGGEIPDQWGMLKELNYLDLSENNFSGGIPESLGDSTALTFLALYSIGLTGNIPSSIGELINLQGLYLSSNFLTGGIPSEIFNCTELGDLKLSGNFLTGSLPNELGSLPALNTLWLDDNMFTGSISPAIRQKSESLLEISLAHNGFSGVIDGSYLGSLQNLQLTLDLSHNLLSGPLLQQIGAFKSIQRIDFSFNEFSGGIPTALSQCIALQSLDLSSNNLDGEVPESLTTLQHLTFFNVSFNQLVGFVPESGPFANFSDESFLGNPHLCGPKLSHDCNTPCHGIHCHQLKIILLAVAANIFLIALALVTLWFWFIHKTSHSRRRGVSNQSNFWNFSHGKFSEAIVLQTIDDPIGDNIIGRGARSIVYRGILPGGQVFALKRLLSNNVHDQNIDPNSEVGGEGEESREIDDLCKEAGMLAKLRHKNIFKVLSFYSNLDHKALILEYMCGGSLHQHLHEMEPCLLLWQTRLKIAVGVAQGVKYLHHDFPEPLIHRDLKPSNILLDEDFEPKVADFGISKFVDATRLREDGEASTSMVCGTIGYMPPEYASQPWVSTKGDVFSYGIVIIELLTRRQPGSTDVENQGRDLQSWILDNFQRGPMDLLDHSLVSECREDDTAMEQMMLLLKVVVFCTSLDPQNRPSMIDVVGMLTNILTHNLEPIIRKTTEELVDDTNLGITHESPIESKSWSM